MLYMISKVVPSNGMVPQNRLGGTEGHVPIPTPQWINELVSNSDEEYSIQSRMEVYEPPRPLRGMSTRIGTKACINRVFLSEAAAKAACVWLSQQFPGQAFGWFEMKAMVEVVPPEHPNLVEKTFTANGELVIHESQ